VKDMTWHDSNQLCAWRDESARQIPFYEWLASRRQHNQNFWFRKEDIREAQAALGPFCLMRKDFSSRFFFCHPGPYYLAYSPLGWDYFVATHRDAFREVGITSKDVVDVSVSFHFVVAGLAYTAALAQIGATVLPGGPGQHDEHARAICDAQVSWLIGFPSFVQRVVQALPDDYRLRGVLCVGEALTPQVRELFASKVDQIALTYGTGESGPFAVGCSKGNFHLLPNSGFEIGFADADGKSIASSDEVAELLFLDRQRPDAPLLGFGTGDLTRPILCSCGRGGLAFEAPSGRRGDLLRVRGHFVDPRDIRDVLAQFGHSDPIQIKMTVSETGEQEICVLLSGGINGAGTVRSPRYLEEALRARCRVRIRVIDQSSEAGK
jgi:phenylacetate-CoA ligase